MKRGGGILELAVLGLLQEAPMHGYELRKRLNLMLGWGRAFSYGSLYPCLKTMLGHGWIVQEEASTVKPGMSRRARIVYRVTDPGKTRFRALLDEVGDAATDDDAFDIRFAFFARTDAAVRLRILEGRRRRLEDRLERVRTQLQRTNERLDSYAVELQRHGLDSVEREVRWLEDQIRAEKDRSHHRRSF